MEYCGGLSAEEKIFLAGFLKRYRRIGSAFVGFSESVGAHTFRVAYIAFEIARMRGEEPGEYAREALYHDFHEAWSMDHHPLAQRFVDVEEPELSDVVHDADILETLITVWEQNVPGFEIWLERNRRRLRTGEGRAILRSVLAKENLSNAHRVMREKKVLDVADRIIIAGALKRFPRVGWYAAGVPFVENVAEHTFRVMVIADILGNEEDVVAALLHDLPEGVAGDHHYLSKLFTRVREKEIWAFLGLEEPEISDAVKDADLLEFVATLREHACAGVKGLEKWEKDALRRLKTKKAREIAERMRCPAEFYISLLERWKGDRIRPGQEGQGRH